MPKPIIKNGLGWASEEACVAADLLFFEKNLRAISYNPIKINVILKPYSMININNFDCMIINNINVHICQVNNNPFREDVTTTKLITTTW